jgi:CheY-like chemotaxis protein
MAGRALGARHLPVAHTSRAQLLVVEDDDDHRETLREVLQDEGYRVETAVHGRDALGRLSAPPLPDLILLDLRMPELDGWGLMAELNARPKLASIPVVVTSQVGDRVPHSAATRYISKPLDRTRLLQTVSSCLWWAKRGGASSLVARVLVVDDDERTGKNIARLLAWDHDVVAVAGAAAALGRIHAGERFDAIFCALDMPDMTAMDLHAKLTCDVPEQAERMVFMTGSRWGLPEDGARHPHDRGAPGARWLEKPFTVTALRASIQGVVKSAAG